MSKRVANEAALVNRFDSLEKLPENIDEALKVVNENTGEVAW